jgi:tetratricopeptide (TPR) repeat protein
MVACLALTCFCTSLVIENRERRSSLGSRPANIAGAMNPVYASPVVALSDAGSPVPGSFPQSAKGVRVEELLKQGGHFLQAGNLLGAAEIYRSVLKMDRENLPALASLGIICFEEESYAEAETCLALTSNLQGEMPLALRARLGVAQMRQGKYRKALENLRLVSVAEPEDGTVYFAMACIRARLGQTKEALDDLNQADLKMGPALLQHISDPDLDSLRNEPGFQDIVRKAREHFLPKELTLDQPAPESRS